MTGSKQKLSLVAVDLLGRGSHGKSRGHNREPSEASSLCSDDNFSDAERLSKVYILAHNVFYVYDSEKGQ